MSSNVPPTKRDIRKIFFLRSVLLDNGVIRNCRNSGMYIIHTIETRNMLSGRLLYMAGGQLMSIVPGMHGYFVVVLFIFLLQTKYTKKKNDV